MSVTEKLRGRSYTTALIVASSRASDCEPVQCFRHCFSMRAGLPTVSRRLSLADHVLLQPGVAEGTARIEPLEQADEVWPALVERSDRGGISQEELAPVRARFEGSESRLDVDQHLLDRVLVGHPREVEAGCVLPVVQ